MNRALPTRSLLVALGVAAGLAALIWPRAEAHYPEIEATFTCTENVVHVEARARSWATGDDERRHNEKVDITWDGRSVGTGRFAAANDYSFALRFDTKPDGATHTIVATAQVPFGRSGEFGFEGTSRQTTLTLPAACAPAATVLEPTRPTTTVSTTTAPTTTAGAAVLGTTVAAPPAQPAVPVAVLPSFTG